MFLAVDQDVITQCLKTNGCQPHVLRHLDSFPNLVLALVE